MATFNEYLETIRDLAVEGAQTAVRKTKQMAAIAKANLAIRTEEDKIKKAQIELGKLYYKDYIVGEDPDPAEYNPWCEKISESKIAIEDLKIAIEDLRSAGAAGVEEEDCAADAAEEVPVEDEASAEPAEEAPAETADAPAAEAAAEAEEKAE